MRESRSLPGQEPVRRGVTGLSPSVVVHLSASAAHEGKISGNLLILSIARRRQKRKCRKIKGILNKYIIRRLSTTAHTIGTTS